MTTRCYNCFKEIGKKKVCPHCGYEQDTPCEPEQLAPGLILAGRYMVGRARGMDDDGIVYNIFDMKNETRRRMREFFPRAHCKRGQDGSVIIRQGHEEDKKRELET